MTGGSSGIGKSVALIAAKMGAHVTIIARDVAKLKSARNEILEACTDRDTQKVEFLSLDVGESYDNVEKAFGELEKTMGPVYMLVNCAGTAICGKIEDTRPADLNLMININLLGTYNCIKAVVPKMKSSRDGIIVLTSSQAATLGTNFRLELFRNCCYPGGSSIKKWEVHSDIFASESYLQTNRIDDLRRECRFPKISARITHFPIIQ